MRRVAAALAATAVVALVVAGPVPAHAAEGLEFLDTRPVVIDLDRASVGQRWRVPVLDGRAGVGHDVFLTLSFRPAGALRVVRPRLVTGEGEVAEFVVELRRAVPGSGELILSSDGVIVRRPISTAVHPARIPVQVSRLQFAGVRLAPFSDRVRTGELTVRDAPGGTGEASAGRVGMLTSSRGDTADVVREGATFRVQGATEVGEYQGSVDLVPARPGGEAEASLRVRDLPIWPLLVLILGLLVVQLLDRYQNRGRPRQLFHLRLARLRDRANAAQRDLPAFRIVALPGEPGLLLDRLVADALARFDEQLTDAERAVWDVGGAEYRKLADLVTSFETLTESARALIRERAAAEGDDAAERALDRSPVGRVLQGRHLRSAVDLTDAAAEVATARTYLREFRRLYRLATEIGADLELRKLRTPPEDLAGLEAEIEERYREWQPPAAHHLPPVLLPPVLVPPAAPAPQHPQQQQRPPAPAGRRSRWWPALGVAAALVALPCLLFVVFTSADDPNPGVLPTPTTGTPGPTTGTPDPSSSAPLPEIPAAPPAEPPPPQAFGPSEPGTARLVLYGGVLPLALAAAAAAAGWWLRRRWRPRRPDLVSASLDRQVRRADLRFAVIGGVLVVLGGMSVLYAGKPAFGTAGDYLAMALWATAFGEGLSLARRLWPQPAGG